VRAGASGILAALLRTQDPGGGVRAMRWMGVILAAGLLTGCAAKMDVSGREWTRPDTGLSQVTWDEYQCVWEADNFIRTPDLIVGGWADIARYTIEERWRKSGFEECMTSRGYRPLS
jgi:hypothetical protein